jgi:hypothetical protein
VTSERENTGSDHTPAKTDGLPAGDRPRDDWEDLGAVGALFRYARDHLKDGGPPVDYAALHAYLDRDLSEQDMLEVQCRINIWKPWYDAVWEIRRLLGGYETNADSSQQPTEGGE